MMARGSFFSWFSLLNYQNESVCVGLARDGGWGRTIPLNEWFKLSLKAEMIQKSGGK